MLQQWTIGSTRLECSTTSSARTIATQITDVSGERPYVVEVSSTTMLVGEENPARPWSCYNSYAACVTGTSAALS
jgi:hypothetical protein